MFIIKIYCFITLTISVFAPMGLLYGNEKSLKVIAYLYAMSLWFISFSILLIIKEMGY